MGIYGSYSANGKSEISRKNLSIYITVLLAIFLWLFMEMKPGIDTYQLLNISNHSRTKRALYMTSQRTLALPKKSSAALDFVFSLPGLRPLPLGFGSENAVAIPVDINFDKIGVTSEENTWGEIPYLKEIQATLIQLRDAALPYIAADISSREIQERSVVFQVLEDTLQNFGVNGTACLLKFICQTHQYTLLGHGLFGELVEMILSVSGIPKARTYLKPYLKAELEGRAGGKCLSYEQECPITIFGPLKKEEQDRETDIRDKFYKKKKIMKKRLEKKNYRKMKEQRKPLRAHRNKRFLFFGPAGRLILPIGALFNTKAEMKLPFMSNLGTGYKSGFNVGVAFRVIFDTLGFTSNINPFLALPTSDLIRRKRETWQPMPGVNAEGGDREVAYSIMTEFLNRWKIDGHSCLLRAICEAHNSKAEEDNLISKSLKLFLSPSNSLHAEDKLPDFLEAEYWGRNKENCLNYYDNCHYSIYSS